MSTHPGPGPDPTVRPLGDTRDECSPEPSPLSADASASVFAVVSLPTGLSVELRPAVASDVPAIIRLLAADQLSRTRDGITDTEPLDPYLRAFEAIDRDPAHLLVTAHTPSHLVGTLQLSFLPGLARRGSWRAQVEGVRVAEEVRGHGLGSAMMRWAIQTAADHGCTLVQLTTDKRRADARRFYQRLGFEPSHEGMKLPLPPAGP